jgi:hypothetical protein
MRSRKSTKQRVTPKGRRGGSPRKRTQETKAKIVIDPVTGFPVLTLGPGAPVLTHQEVKVMLYDFP